MVVTTRAKTLAMPILEEFLDAPSKDSLHFLELEKVLKEARKNVKKVKAKGNEPPPLELNDDEVFQLVRDEKLRSGMTLVLRVIHAQSHNPFEPYDLWDYFFNTKAQLIQVAPSIKNNLKKLH